MESKPWAFILKTNKPKEKGQVLENVSHLAGEETMDKWQSQDSKR